jgi:murein L,D-transpeptidase YcbB/YkuD
MKNRTVRNRFAVCALGALVLLGGCHRHRKTRSAPKSDSYADKLKPIVESKHLQVLHWPNFSDYEPLVQTFYDDRNYEVAWVNTDNGIAPSPQATAFIAAFKDAAHKGLKPEDYDASRWDALVAKLASKNDDDIAEFDAAMTVSVMRYISDLRIGRVNPTHFNFDIDTADKKYDLPEFVSDNAVDATDVPKLIASVEPDADQYRRTEQALAHYIDLAQKQAGDPTLQQPLPAVTKPLSPGEHYPAADAVAARLQLEGDMAAPPPPPPPAAPQPANSPKKPKTVIGRELAKVQENLRSRTHLKASQTTATASPAAPPAQVKPPSTVYTAELSDAVKHYQERHGYTQDGKLTPQVVAALNIPLTARVQQLDDSLERWRWLPNEYVNAPLMVNLPEFLLRGFSDDGTDKHHLDFTMKVVVGKVMGDHDTPVFAHMMKYLIFRPYWNVPTSIIKKELTGHIQKSGVGYLASHNFETTDNSGHVVQATAAQVEHFNVAVREKPGPKNSLGLIKFMFPNEYDIYLHSTPQPELFERTRRDFSHGCVRVQKPAELAVWVLKRGGVEGDWDLEKVTDAMQNGPDNHQVNLKQPLPIVIFYLTANVGEDGDVHFFDDLYGYDKQLDAVLAKGMPYPSAQQKVNPKGSPEGTD